MKEQLISLVNNFAGKRNSIEGKGDNWINIASLGAFAKNKNVDIKGKLQPALAEFPDAFEIYVDTSKLVNVVYVRAKCANIQTMTYETTPRKNYERKYTQKLEDWAYLIDINVFLDKLSDMALGDEVWDFNNGMPPYPHHPVLYSYIKTTFCRLQYEGKIAISVQGDRAAFNTGLVDHRYMPIIALFKRNRPGRKSEWIFDDFVINGENKGKIITNEFIEEIKSACYTDNPHNLIYDERLGEPIIDIEHIIMERIERLPVDFLKKNIPFQFDVQDTSKMKGEQKVKYIEGLRNMIIENGSVYRSLISGFKYAVELAVKRVKWNYKNAVPMFYPKTNTVNLLLPLCLVNDKTEDLALVVQKTPANKYEGVTILPMDLAYADARVIARPNSEWLDIKKIEGDNNNV